MPYLSFAQSNNFIIRGKIGHYNTPAKIYLVYNDGEKNITDSAALKDGNFEFKGTVNDVVRGNLILSRKGNGIHRPYDRMQFYIDKGLTTINSTDSAARATVTGNKVNADNIRLNQLMQPVEDGYRSMEHLQNTASSETQATETFKDKMDSLESTLEKQSFVIRKTFIENNPSSIVSLNAVAALCYGSDYKDVNALFLNLSPVLKNTAAGQKVMAQLEKIKPLALGHTAPEFTQADTSGIPVKLSSFRGKYVLVDFWASWCAPCRAENPNVLKVYNEFKNKNFTVFSVSLDSQKDKALWLKAIAADHLPWTQASDLKGWQNEAAQLYNVIGIPSNYLIGPDGSIIAKNLRGKNLSDKLSELIK